MNVNFEIYCLFIETKQKKYSHFKSNGHETYARTKITCVYIYEI